MTPHRQPADLGAMVAAVHQFSAAAFPGLTPKAVRISFVEDAEPLTLPLTALAARPVVPITLMSDREEDILMALEEAAEPVVGRELAERAGYVFDSAFRQDLARLTRVGRVRNCNPGYVLVRAEGGEG